MRNLLLSAFILLSYYSNAQQHIVGTYSDGRTYAVTDTLRDAEVCSFRLSNGERADWKVEISPYNDETVLCSAKDTAALEMKVMPYPRNVWREASLARHREDTTRDCDYVYYKGRVCCSSASGVKDTLNLVFDVLPTRPKLIAMHLSDFEIDQEYPDASECHVAVDVSIQNTNLYNS